MSAFAKTNGDSLFYGANDNGEVWEFLPRKVMLTPPAKLSRPDFPVPEVELISLEYEGRKLLEVRVKAGTLTPYYYYQYVTRTAYVRL